MADQVMPKMPATKLPIPSERRSILFRIIPTVAEKMAQPKIWGKRAEAASNPSLIVGSPPLKRMIAPTCLALLVHVSASQAADYPTKPIELVVPASAGGGTDTLARAFAEAAKKQPGGGDSRR